MLGPYYYSYDETTGTSYGYYCHGLIDCYQRPWFWMGVGIFVGTWSAVGLILFLIWNSVCKGQRRATRTVEKESFTGELKPATLCGCVELACRNVTEAIFCSVCVFAENVEKALPKSQRCGVFGQSVCQFMSILLGLFTCYLPWIYCVMKHMNLRTKYSKLPEGVRGEDECMSCMKAFFCLPCSSMQIAEFRELYETAYGKAEDEETALLDGKI